jgi:hypothetical protein
MLKSNEFRIGNLLTDLNGQNREVTCITKEGIMTEPIFPFVINPVIQIEDVFEFILPIDFNEEWFKKIEFEYLEIRYEFDTFWIYQNYRRVSSFKYLHELQNLCFILTGNELNYANII